MNSEKQVQEQGLTKQMHSEKQVQEQGWTKQMHSEKKVEEQGREMLEQEDWTWQKSQKKAFAKWQWRKKKM